MGRGRVPVSVDLETSRKACQGKHPPTSFRRAAYGHLRASVPDLLRGRTPEARLDRVRCGEARRETQRRKYLGSQEWRASRLSVATFV